MLHLGMQATRFTVPAIETIPVETSSITVSDAGTSDCNGVYFWDYGESAWLNPVTLNYVLWNSSLSRWEITTGLGGTVFYSNLNGDSGNCPKTAWTTELGAAPAPTIS